MENPDLIHEDKTLQSKRFSDVYYHKGNGLDESRYVFLEGNKLKERLGNKDMVISETGFGTGLNFLALWQLWRQLRSPGSKLIFQSIELYPLSRNDMKKVHEDWPELKELSNKLLEKYNPESGSLRSWHWSDENLTLTIHFKDAVEGGVSGLPFAADAWFLDGFNPETNPELWNQNLYDVVYQNTKINGTLATFTAKGDVRRGLQTSGFKITKKKGFGFKRHMTTGIKTPKSPNTTME